MRRIALIGCSKKKLGKNCPNKKFKANDIYLGNNFKKALNEGIEYFNCKNDFYILSDKYELLSKNDKISYYDVCLRDFSIYEKKKWASNVLQELKNKFNLVDTEFVIFASDIYCKYIKNHINCIVLKFNYRNITFQIKETTKII